MSTSKSEPVMPVVGMGATAGYGSDCYPFTITTVYSPNRIGVKRDIFKPTAKHTGMFGVQDYTYETDHSAQETIYTRRKNGGWAQPGESIKAATMYIGHRRYYQDPSF
jgi:hypothetical protein